MRRHFAWSTGRPRRLFLGQGSLRVRAVHSELIPAVQVESQRSVGWPIRRDFSRFVIIS